MRHDAGELALALVELLVEQVGATSSTAQLEVWSEMLAIKKPVYGTPAFEAWERLEKFTADALAHRG